MPLPASNSTKAGRRANMKSVMGEWKSGALRSGSKKGPVVRSQKQAVAIALSETGQSTGQQSVRNRATMPVGRGKESAS